MKKAKIKEQKETKHDLNTDVNIRNGIIVMLAVIVFFLGFYLLTDYLINNKKSNNNNNGEKATTNEITFNKLLSQKETEYYVLAIFEKDKNESIYKIYTKDLKNVYSINMKDAFNKNHIGEETKITDTIKDIVLNDSTVFHIKDGKIEGYYVGNTDIINYLKTLIKVES